MADDGFGPVERRVLWKFPVEAKPSFEVELPVGAQVVFVGQQMGQRGPEVNMWALCDPDALKVKRKFGLVATGEPFFWRPGLEYRGTFMLQGGVLVFHLLERTDTGLVQTG